MIAKDSLSVNAMGGTELMKKRLVASVDKELLDQFQIFFSRVEEELDTSKLRVLYCHDLPNDPASSILANGGWKNFHKIVFVSNWQMQAYMGQFSIPWSRCTVIKNAINPIPEHEKPNDGVIRLAYWSTPHRGLELLIPAFEAIAEKRENVVLDVYSSFSLYGWEERDHPYMPLFDRCRDHPRINYYGTVSNEQIREAIQKTHIFAYPNIWPETSCLCLMEAMSGGLACIHPNYAALYETSMNQTYMYQFNENPNVHASDFATFLDLIIGNYWSPEIQHQLKIQKLYADSAYNLHKFSVSWNYALTQLVNELEAGLIDKGLDKDYFTLQI